MSIETIIFLCLFNCLFVFYFDFISLKLNIYSKTIYKKKEIKKKVPLTGGIFLLLNFNILVFFSNNTLSFPYESNILIILMLSNFLFIIGFLDDKINLNPYWKLLLFTIFSLFILNYYNFLSIYELRFSFTGKVLELGQYSFFFTLFAIFVFINALNMFDGINGHTGIYTSFVMGAFFILSSKLIFLYFLILILIFLYLNLKNKFFIGNSGTFFLGMFISSISIFFYNEGIIKFSDDIFLIMFLPGVDLIRLFFLRIINKKNPFSRDHNHWHHIISHTFGNNLTLLVTGTLCSFPFMLSAFSALTNFYIIIISCLFYLLTIYFCKKNINF
tara:strand:- start:2011 stop:3000 length:990 start_codon:yes stop_codon:yes gene_type:complete